MSANPICLCRPVFSSQSLFAESIGRDFQNRKKFATVFQIGSHDSNISGQFCGPCFKFLLKIVFESHSFLEWKEKFFLHPVVPLHLIITQYSWWYTQSDMQNNCWFWRHWEKECSLSVTLFESWQHSYLILSCCRGMTKVWLSSYILFRQNLNYSSFLAGEFSPV